MPLNHISINVADIDKTREFYIAALKPLGYRVVMDYFDGKVVGMGGSFVPDFWFSSLDAPSADGSETRHKDINPDSVKPGNKTPTGMMHIAFGASSRQKVREFYDAAIAAGATCNGPPGLRPEYFATYYGAFVLDPEGRNIEAYCNKPAFLAEPWGYKGWSTVGLAVGAAAGGVGKYMGWV